MMLAPWSNEKIYIKPTAFSHPKWINIPKDYFHRLSLDNNRVSLWRYQNRWHMRQIYNSHFLWKSRTNIFNQKKLFAKADEILIQNGYTLLPIEEWQKIQLLK
jgi:hypothetical protein